MGRISEVRVRVPGSSANLGPGFDTLGLALGLYDEIEVTAASGGVLIEVVGEGADRVPCDETHLVVAAMRRTWNVIGDAPAGLRMRCRNAIPHARGLGSSAAAVVAGALAAVVLSGRDPIMEMDTLLQVTAGMEGHADNAAASLLGGLVVAWQESAQEPDPESGNKSARFHAERVDVHPSIHPVAFVAEVESSTHATRGLLPKQVPLADAAFTAGRTALGVLAFTQQPWLLLAATEDRLHQPYRRSAYPESLRLVEALRERGIPAAISGAGPTVLAFTADGVPPHGLDVEGFTPLSLPVDGEGARAEFG